MTLSLSTMWAQQERFVADMHAFVRETLALGYDAIEIAHSTAGSAVPAVVMHAEPGIGEYSRRAVGVGF